MICRPRQPTAREEQAEPRVVAQHRVEAAVRHLLPRAVDQPGGVGLRPDRLPDLLLQVVRHRPPDRVTKHQAQHLGLDRA